MHGHARRPEDEQPHSDKHHAGNLPGGPQNQRRVPDSFTEPITDVTHHSLPSFCKHGCGTQKALESLENTQSKRRSKQSHCSMHGRSFEAHLNTLKTDRFQSCCTTPSFQTTVNTIRRMTHIHGAFGSLTQQYCCNKKCYTECNIAT